MTKKKWLFLDVGNVILNDDPNVSYSYKRIHDFILEKTGSELTFDQFLHQRNQIFQTPGKRLPKDLVLKYLSQDDADIIKQTVLQEIHSRWTELNPLIPKAKEFIDKAYSRFHLGIIANQPEACLDTLNYHSLTDYFKIIGLSDVVGTAKPDIRFFEWALREANTVPENSIMVGDRLDNDIAPARTIGMTGIHFRLDLQSKGDIIHDHHELYFHHLKDFNVSYRKPKTDHEIPDYTAHSFQELEEILLNI